MNPEPKKRGDRGRVIRLVYSIFFRIGTSCPQLRFGVRRRVLVVCLVGLMADVFFLSLQP